MLQGEDAQGWESYEQRTDTHSDDRILRRRNGRQGKSLSKQRVYKGRLRAGKRLREGKRKLYRRPEGRSRKGAKSRRNRKGSKESEGRRRGWSVCIS